ncbi:hypothetical protein RB195_000933 [Necator americanus]|uniref:Uncharacterized protein n=1 Tax=Necator americanus TaxID=51031 RepID=A0ABR1DC24_NECAM
MAICTYNARTLASEAAIEDLMMRAKKIKEEARRVLTTKTILGLAFEPSFTLDVGVTGGGYRNEMTSRIKVLPDGRERKPPVREKSGLPYWDLFARWPAFGRFCMAHRRECAGLSTPSRLREEAESFKPPEAPGRAAGPELTSGSQALPEAIRKTLREEQKCWLSCGGESIRLPVGLRRRRRGDCSRTQGTALSRGGWGFHLLILTAMSLPPHL